MTHFDQNFLPGEAAAEAGQCIADGISAKSDSVAQVQHGEWEAVQNICLETAGLGENADPKQKSFTLLMYCRWYLENGLVFVLHDEEGNAVGYILCAEDYAHYEAAFVPYLAEIEQLGGMYPLMARSEMQTYSRFAPEYPAHLHIDILEAYTGRGGGRKLMCTLLDALRKKGVPGIMLQVDAQNARAIAYYKKMGFAVLEESAYALTMGQKLKRR